MTPERTAIVAALPLEEWCRAVLDDAPKTSAKDLLTMAVALGKCPADTAKSRIARIRDAWKVEKTADMTPEDEAPQAPTLEETRKRLAEAVAIGDHRAAASYARTVAILAGLEPEAEAEPDQIDWSRLSPVQGACLGALVALAAGQDLTDDHVWFMALLARVPELRVFTHPAHVPLPEVPRPGVAVGP